MVAPEKTGIMVKTPHYAQPSLTIKMEYAV